MLCPYNGRIRLQKAAAAFVFYEEAGVHYDYQAGGDCFSCGFDVFDSQLHPDDVGADGDGAVGYGRDAFGAAEDVDDFDFLRCDRGGSGFQVRVGFFAEDFPFVWIHRNHAIAGGLDVIAYVIAGAFGI